MNLFERLTPFDDHKVTIYRPQGQRIGELMRKAHIKIMQARKIIFNADIETDVTDDQLFELEQAINGTAFRCHIDPIDSSGIPTKEGFLRWEPTGMYDGVPCTCRPTCEDPCVGKTGCKCEACYRSHQDYLSSPSSTI